jgi:DNA-binding NarL/FixJ family response regulator
MSDPRPPKPISFLICDDERLLTDALSVVFDASSDVEMVHPPVNRGDEAVDIARREQPDVVLMDVRLGEGLDGIEATKRIKTVSPRTSVIVVTGDPSATREFEAIEAGASGILSKDEAVESVVDSVVRAAAGQFLFDNERLPALIWDVGQQRRRSGDLRRRLASLTEREREILDAIRRGDRRKEIAAGLYISPRTVATHTQNILRKLGVHSQLAAVALLDEAERSST